MHFIGCYFCVQVLEYFHQQKKQRGVDEALLRLYEPIIWRAFKVGTGHTEPVADQCLTYLVCYWEAVGHSTLILLGSLTLEQGFKIILKLSLGKREK